APSPSRDTDESAPRGLWAGGRKKQIKQSQHYAISTSSPLTEGQESLAYNQLCSLKAYHRIAKHHHINQREQKRGKKQDLCNGVGHEKVLGQQRVQRKSDAKRQHKCANAQHLLCLAHR